MRITITLIATCLLSGCWIRQPSRGSDTIRAYVGHTATVNKPIPISRDWDGTPTAFLNTNKTIDTIYPGTTVKAVSVVSRRLPPGVVYYLVLKPLPPIKKRHFDFCIGMVDEPDFGFDGTFVWTK
jgi:hypothetical protein